MTKLEKAQSILYLVKKALKESTYALSRIEINIAKLKAEREVEKKYEDNDSFGWNKALKEQSYANQLSSLEKEFYKQTVIVSDWEQIEDYAVSVYLEPLKEQ